MSDNGQAIADETARRARLGEELPVFCEKCGYSLHGLTQIRCHACEVLHFACPECGHHQPINTLRPAFQRVLGRLRAQSLALIAFLKINFFFWTLFIWGAAGADFAYDYLWTSRGNGAWQPAPMQTDEAIGTFVFGFFHGMIGRMLLLRWRRGWMVALALGTLIVLAMTIGAHLSFIDREEHLPSPLQPGFIGYMLWAFVGVSAGGACAWGVWLALVNLFLPKRAATALLEWQRKMSARDDQPDRTDATTSVTA